MNPKICIVFNSGSGGDFFTALVASQLVDKEIRPNIDNNGMFLNPPGEPFKKACERFFLEKFKTNPFTNIDIGPVVNTHHCYQQVVDLFPECKFYYIDNSEYIPLTIEVYIKKRIIPSGETLTEWLHKNNSFPDIKKINNLTDNQIRKVMINDWTKCLNGWKNLNLIPIKLAEILDKEKCRNIIEYIVQSSGNSQKFDQIYDSWASKNSDLITGIKYKS